MFTECMSLNSSAFDRSMTVHIHLLISKERTFQVSLSGIKLTHLPVVPHIYVREIGITIDSDNGLSPGRRQTII